MIHLGTQVPSFFIWRTLIKKSPAYAFVGILGFLHTMMYMFVTNSIYFTMIFVNL